MHAASIRDFLLRPARTLPEETAFQSWMRRLSPAFFVALTAVVPTIVFLGVYRGLGVLPWEHGLFDRVSDRAGAQGIATDAQILLGMGWLFAIPFLAAVASAIAAIPLRRAALELTPMAVLLVAAPLMGAFIVSFERHKASVVVTAVERRTLETEHRHAKGILERHGLAVEAQALDARFERMMGR